MNANDPSILSGYLLKSMDKGKTWNKRWFVVTKEFAMYEFKAHHVSLRDPKEVLDFLMIFSSAEKDK